MKKTWTLFLLTSLILAGCISVSSNNEGSTAPPQFVTSTLPPTKAFVLPASATPSTNVAGTGTPAKPAATASTAPADCKVQAVLLEDVTIPDDTLVDAGSTFTKTWRFKNTGTCHWTGYTVNFLTGDRMGAPDSAPIPETIAGDTVDVSLDLTAPNTNGSYSAYFTLKNADGESVLIGTEKTFWVKITVGDGTAAAPTATPGGITGNNTGGSSTTTTKTQCNVDENTSYVAQIHDLINQERKKNSLPELTISPQLTAAAQLHSDDMACNNLLSHSGSDGSYVNTRIAATGYSASYSEEIIYAGGDAQTAFNWWMNDKLHRDAILSTKSTEMGIGYAYLSSSPYGGYFTVDFASP